MYVLKILGYWPVKIAVEMVHRICGIICNDEENPVDSIIVLC